MKISLVLADDHPIVLDGLEQLFDRERDFQILDRCADGNAALRSILFYRPDVAVIDVRMPAKDGLTVLKELSATDCPTRVVLLTAALTEDEVMQAIRDRVAGLVLKEMASKLLVQCVRTVYAGEQWLESSLVTRALEKMMQREASSNEVARILTPRETEVVRMVASGLRNKEIAERLTITEGTVKIHLHTVYEKLHVSGRVELTIYARDKGLV